MGRPTGSWQQSLQKRLQTLASDLMRKYEIQVVWHRTPTFYNGTAVARGSFPEWRPSRLKRLLREAAPQNPDVEPRIILSPPIRGYVSFAIFCHELFHLLLGHCDIRDRKRGSKAELEAWGAVKTLFEENGLAWQSSVQYFARNCLGAMLQELEERAKKGDPEAQKELENLEPPLQDMRRLEHLGL
jgi:hypothetical protein